MMGRTSALEGKYRSHEEMKMISSADNTVNVTVYKSVKTEPYTISYYERRPVFMLARGITEYMGRQINDRELRVNNGDFTGSNSLYNREFFKGRNSVLWLESMNATVLSTDEFIIEAKLKTTKYLGCAITSRTDGVQDLSYGLRDSSTISIIEIPLSVRATNAITRITTSLEELK